MTKIIDWLRLINQIEQRGATEKEIEILGEAMVVAQKYTGNSVNYQKAYSYRMDQIIFGTQRDAEKVFKDLMNLAEMYRVISVADYYDLCAVTPHYGYADAKYGWCAKEIKNSAIHRCVDGYTIDLPNPSKLN